MIKFDESFFFQFMGTYLSAKDRDVLLYLVRASNSQGAVKLSKCIDDFGKARNTIARYLKNLADWGIIDISTEKHFKIKNGGNAKIIAINSEIVCNDKWTYPLYSKKIDLLLNAEKLGNSDYMRLKVVDMIDNGAISLKAEKYALSIIEKCDDNGYLSNQQIRVLKKMGIK